MEELLGSAIYHFIFGGIGRAYLFLRYRNTAKVLKVRNEIHEGSYAEAGIYFLLMVFIGCFVIGMLLLIGILIYHNIK